MKSWPRRVAGMVPVQDVALRDPSEWRYLGKPMQRVDILAKSTGTQAYGIDFETRGHGACRCEACACAGWWSL